MPYIGTEPLTGQFKKLDAITVVNGQAAYTLNYNSAAYKPATANALLVSVNGVIQAAGDAYTINGSTITFTENLVTGDVIDFIIALGDTGSAVTPVDGSVTTAKLGDDSVTKAKIGTTELDLATIKDSSGSNTAMTIDSSGRVLFPQIPCACVTINLSNSQDTINPYSTTGADILFNVVTINQGSVYNSSNGRFTAPVAGIYEFSYTFLKDDDSGANVTYMDMYKNGSSYVSNAGSRNYDNNPSTYGNMSQKTLVDLAANDYLTLRLISGAFHLDSGGSYHSVIFKLVG